MKPKIRSLAPLLALTVSCTVQSLHAAPGVWTGTTSGSNWNDAANWSGGTIADGSGSLADFTTVDLPAGAFVVNLDTARTIGSLSFNDFDLATAGTWTVSGANTLTLAGTPTITTSVNTTISSVVGGTAGYTKEGAGTLTLTGDNSTALTGTITLNAGTVSLITGSVTNLQKAIGNAANPVVFQGGTLSLNGSTTNDNGSAIWSPFANPISIASGQSGTLNCFPRGSVTSVLTGSGTLNLGLRATRCDITGNWSAFTGTINATSLTGSPEFRVNSTGPLANAKVNLGANVKMLQAFNPAGGDAGTTQNIGELSGVAGSLLAAQPVGGRFVNWTIGALNTDSTFAGNIINDTESGIGFGACRIVKVGTGTLTLTGTNTFTGSTVTTPGVRVNDGTLAIGSGGATGSLGNTDTQVAAIATLVFNRDDSAVSTYPGVLSGDGNVIKRGTGQVNFSGVNTFTNGITIEGGLIGVTNSSSLGDIAGTVAFSVGNGGLISTAPAVVVANLVTLDSGITASFGSSATGNSLELSGEISGMGSVNIDGTGVVSISSSTNSYSGSTTVSSGSLVAANASGSATGTGSVSLTGGTLAGTGTLSGAVSASATSSIRPGTLTPTSSGVGGPLTVGALDLSGGSTIYNEFLDSLTYDRIVVTDANALTSSANSGNPVLVDLRVSNTTAKWTTPGTYDIIQYSGSFSGDPDAIFEVTAASQQAGLSYAFSDSGGFIRLTISGALPSEWNVDSDGLWSDSGNWLNGVPDAVGATAAFGGVITSPRTVTLDSSHTVGLLQFNNAQSYSISGTSTLTFNQLVDNAGISVILGDHAINSPVSLADSIDLVLSSASDSLVLGGVIDGPGGIIKSTVGDLTLGGNNTFSGNVTFANGSLSFAQGGLGTGDLSLEGSTLVWLGGNTQDISSRSITFAAGTNTFDVGSNDVVLANPFGGGSTDPFVKQGAGKLTLAADADFSGPVAINDGPLQLGDGGTTGSVTGAIANEGGLIIDLSADLILSQIISGTGGLQHAGASVVTLAGANTFTGETSITNAGGSLFLAAPTSLQGSTLAYSSTGGVLDFGFLTNATLGGLSGDQPITLDNLTPAPLALTVGANGQDTTYSGAIGGGGSFIKSGSGNLTLSGTSSIAGSTTVNAGIITLSGSLTTSLAAINSGELNVEGGTLTCSATSTFGTSSAGGTLRVTNSGSTTFTNIQSGTGDNGLISVEDGLFSAASVLLQRTGNGGTGVDPNATPTGSGFVVSGGTATITGALTIGTSNSSATSLISGGSTAVGGVVTIGNSSNTRWSMLEVNGGEFTSTDAVTGILLSPNVGVANRSAFIVSSSGVATVEKITMGTGTSAAGTGRVAVAGGTLYLGSGGIVQEATTFTPQINLSGGTLAAKAAWSTSLPVDFVGLSTSTIKTADALDVPFDITLSGPLSGIGSLEKTGAGTLTLSAASTHAGNIAVLAGVLKVQTKSFADDATVSVDVISGATLDLDFAGGDKVGFFQIDGNLQLDGIYGSMTNTTPGITQTPAITGPGLLYVNLDPPSSSAYATWASDNGLIVGENDGPNQDPDNDDIANQLEFVLGGNPLASSTGVLPVLVPDPSNFIFTFNRQDESITEVGLTFQYGSNLSGWTDIAIPESSAGSVTVTPGTPVDAISVSIPKGANTLMFGRLKAVK